MLRHHSNQDRQVDSDSCVLLRNRGNVGDGQAVSHQSFWPHNSLVLPSDVAIAVVTGADPIKRAKDLQRVHGIQSTGLRCLCL